MRCHVNKSRERARKKKGFILGGEDLITRKKGRERERKPFRVCCCYCRDRAHIHRYLHIHIHEFIRADAHLLQLDFIQ